MPDDGEALRRVMAAFARCGRPERFSDCACPACVEQDEAFQSLGDEILRVEDVGNPVRYTLSHLNPAGLGYLFPALARLALAEPDPTHDWFGVELLTQLTYAPQGGSNRHLRAFDPDQRRAVADFLRHLVETRSQLADTWLSSDNLLYALDLWSDGARATES